MNINIGLLLHNEEEIFRLLTRLRECGSRGVVQVLDDYSEKGFAQYVEKLCHEYGFRFNQRALEYDFGAQRNHLMDLLPKDEWVFIIDCDELVEPPFLDRCVEAIKATPNADSFRVSRRNVVIGYDGSKREAMERHVRLFQNVETVRWHGKIHEGVSGFKYTADLPDELEIAHIKTEARGTKQHLWYDAHFYKLGIT